MSSISKAADHAADQGRNATLMVRALLAHVGRRREASHLSSVLWFAAGATVAGGAFLLLAPRGSNLRSRIGSFVARLNETEVPRDRNGENAMANEGGGSTPGLVNEHQPAH
jgi:hypothetical protein